MSSFLSALVFLCYRLFVFFFFFNDTATTEIYTLSLHDALPISSGWRPWPRGRSRSPSWRMRSEEHTSELQSNSDLVCRLLLEKKKASRPTITSLSDPHTPTPSATRVLPH